MIDLKRTLYEAGISQSNFAKSHDVSKQVVWYWINNHLPKSWEKLILTEFTIRSITIFEKESKVNLTS